MIQHKRRFLLSFILASTLLLPACGGGNNSASPQVNTGNIPNLATRPSAQASQLKTVRVAGSVFDGLTGEPIDQAEILLEIQDLSTANSNLSTPSSASTPIPGSTAVPSSMIPMTPPGNIATPRPTSPTPLPSSSASSLPANENVPPLPATSPALENSDASLPIGMASLRFPPLMAAVAPAFILAQNTAISPSPADQPDAFKTKSNNRGKFFLNDVPEGQYILTVTAPGYRTLTLTQINPNQMEIPLSPQNTERLIDVIGSVLSPATEEPVSDATVSSSFLLGEAIGVPAITDGAGQFLLPAVPFGKRSLVAFVQDPDQRITKMGTIKDLLINSKSLKQQSTAFPGSSPTPKASPTADPTRRKSLEDKVEGILNDASPSPSSVDIDPGFQDTFPELPEASPILEPSSPTDPAEPKEPDLPSEFDPGNNSVDLPVENEEEAAEADSFNFFDAAKELITGKKPEASSDEKTYPVISLHSVLSDMVLAGNVSLPEGYTLKSMDVYMILPTAKNAHPQEVYLYSKQFRAVAKTEPVKTKGLATRSQAAATPAPAASASAKASEPFRVSLPEPLLTEKYHLQFTATDKDGRLTYHHLYNLDAANEKLEVSFLPVPTLIEIEGEDVNAIPPAPGFGWDAVAGAEVYHVTLAAGSGAKRRVVWEAWTKSTQLKYPLSRKPYRLKEQEVYTLSVDALKGLTPAFNGKRQQTAHPAYQMIWTDLSRMTHTPFEVVE